MNNGILLHYKNIEIVKPCKDENSEILLLVGIRITFHMTSFLTHYFC